MPHVNTGALWTAGIVSLLGSSLVTSASGQCSPQQIVKLVASEVGPSVGDRFGCSVAVSGDTAVVGAYSDNDEASDAGAAYVFVASGATWVQQAKLKSSDPSINDQFGWSVAVSGNTAVIGARFDDHGSATDAGSAYVFVRSGTTWSQQAKLTVSDPANQDDFGGSVAVSGDTAIVGARGDEFDGSAYVFVRNGTTWTQQAMLTSSDASGFDNFGNSVAIAGDTVVVGAEHNDHTGLTNPGAAYVFVRSGTTWTQQAKLTASDATGGEEFGYSVAVSGDTAMAGAISEDLPGVTNAGSAYIFVRNGTTWSQEAKLIASDPGSSDEFGTSVAVSGDSAVVGAKFDDHTGGANAGSAYVFFRSGTTWSQQAKLTAPDAAAQDQFGVSVAVSGDIALVGSLFADLTVGGNEGAAYVFDLNCESCPADFNDDCVVDGLDMAILLGAWGPCAGCDEDLNGDDVVNGLDLAILLAAWGTCDGCSSLLAGGGEGGDAEQHEQFLQWLLEGDFQAFFAWFESLGQ